MIKYSAPLLRLPVVVDVARLKEEATQFPRHLWRPDRLSAADPTSYTSFPLVSHRGRNNHLMFGPFARTDALAACPYIRQLLAWFDAPVCEVRLRWLGPRAFGAFHFDWHMLFCDRVRIHVPISSTPHASFACGDHIVHMPEGSAWTFDRMSSHNVFNDDPTMGRLHLIMDFTVSARLRELMDRSSMSTEHATPAPRYEPVSFDASAEPSVVFETDCPPPIWSPGRLRDALADIRARFSDDAGFAAMAATTDAFLTKWTDVWDRHQEQETGWPEYRTHARDYYAAWRDRFPMRATTDNRSETSWIACLLLTGAYDPDRSPTKPSWSAEDALRLTDTLHVVLGVDGRASVLLAGQRHGPTPPSALLALPQLARGATPSTIRETIGAQGFDEALPTLHWLARAGALRPTDAPHRLRLWGEGTETPSEVGRSLVPRSTFSRLRAIGNQLANACFQATEELHFLIEPGGNVMAYVPCVGGYVHLVPGALAIAQHMASGQPVSQIAKAPGYGVDDDFLLVVAWLWDLLPFSCEADDHLRRPTFVHRLDADEAVSLPTVDETDPARAIDWLAEMGACAVVLDSMVHGADALRIALARARLKHVDVLVKTSRRARMADLLDLPIAGLVVAECDGWALEQLESALEGREAPTPFVIAVIETMTGLRSLESIACSPLVDALVVGAYDLANGAHLGGADGRAVVAEADASVRRLAARHEKVWAVAAYGEGQAKSARARGARLILGGIDETTFSPGAAEIAPPTSSSHGRRALPRRRPARATRGACPQLRPLAAPIPESEDQVGGE